ncbi:metalloregulator ArsR/SmtB family transcription factor [Pseudodesulfovibrio thermohalotolerans]|uniref:ArsR/SmtB family transcription factor n=1 Tax=Pseudodesulfovibrio thermohalotolerans TaxID=2880651 RepID=UPI0022B9E74C|nr:metalloregulator ArsR/SmtB family transcription factor [Pseudodesulfovibrio thermohalotolerans]WFS61760.1 metalloregulator ArsR/SmtB family transcription factor [Pseudodesulfovibrio thermohalotolerans]
MEQLAKRFKGLCDPTRLRIIRLLDHGELCVCDLMAALDLPQSTVSRHMSFLRKGDWVNSRRKGKWVYYTLAKPQGEIQNQVLSALKRHLPALEQAQQDHARLMEHLANKIPKTCS